MAERDEWLADGKFERSTQITDHANFRQADIRGIIEIVKAARNDAIELDLKFEAYLLDMAAIALSEQLQIQILKKE